MEPQSSLLNEFEEKEKLGTLKTLTILTFIGSGVLFLASLWGFVMGKSGYDKMQQAINDGTVDKLPEFFKSQYTPEKMELMKKAVDNGLPIFIISTICYVLCMYGALQMRKQKKEGYWLWLIGELLPFFATAFFVGIEYFVGLGSYFAIAIVLTFIILYSVQRKHLTR